MSTVSTRLLLASSGLHGRLGHVFTPDQGPSTVPSRNGSLHVPTRIAERARPLPGQLDPGGLQLLPAEGRGLRVATGWLGG